MARARCVVAEAEIAFVSRDLGWPAKALEEARATLEAHGDRVNAAHARHLEIRRLLLIGRLDEAERALAELDPTPLPAGVEDRSRAGGCGDRYAAPADEGGARRAGSGRARARATHGIPALTAEVERACLVLNTPAARLIASGEERLLLLEEVEALLGVKRARRRRVPPCRAGRRKWSRWPRVPCCSRSHGRSAEAWPGDVARDTLVARAFGSKFADESHRARLRVEVGRLRRVLGTLAGVSATKRGFALTPRGARKVVVLARPVEEEHAAVLAFLTDGESWSSSALALALGASQRTVQRALDSLAAAGKVQSFGRGRARRWMTPPVPGFTTTLLLPAPLPVD